MIGTTENQVGSVTIKDLFDVCACHVLNSWQTLAVIREHVDVPADEVREDLQTLLGHTRDFFTTEGLAVSAPRLTENLIRFVETVFNVELEDGSTPLVAAALVGLFRDVYTTVAARAVAAPNEAMDITSLLEPMLAHLPVLSTRKSVNMVQESAEFDEDDAAVGDAMDDDGSEDEEDEDEEEEIEEDEAVNEEEQETCVDDASAKELARLGTQRVMLSQESHVKLAQLVDFNYELREKRQGLDIELFGDLRAGGFSELLDARMAAQQARVQASAPIVDEDGFETVRSGRRRR